MMSLEYMNSLARKAARTAQQEKKVPYTFSGLGTDAIADRIRYIPYLGKRRNKAGFDRAWAPRGWKRVDAPKAQRWMGCESGYLFVDASGCGAPNEPALTKQEFVDYIYANKDLGYAIVESGQFQVVIATYSETSRGEGRLAPHK